MAKPSARAMARTVAESDVVITTAAVPTASALVTNTAPFNFYRVVRLD
mgnify:CR=1 FL=1